MTSVTHGTSAPTGTPGHHAPIGDTAFARFHRPLVGLIMLLLAALVSVPALMGRHREALRERRVQIVIPAQEALQESRILLIEQLAAVRGYLLDRETLHLVRLQDAVMRGPPAIERLSTFAGRVGPETAAAARDFAARANEWQAVPRGLLSGSLSRAELIESLTSGQDRLEAAYSAADQVTESLDQASSLLDDRGQNAERMERTLTIILALAALATALLMVWVTSRVQRVTRQLEDRAEDLRESEERFRLIADNLREMIWISDPAYTIQYYLSPAYERIWGRSIEAAQRNPRSFLEAVVPEDRDGVETALLNYSRGEYAAEYRIMRPDGEIRWISGRAYPVYDENGNIFRIAGIAEDITEQKRVEQELEQLLKRERLARQESDAALRLRDQVVRIVSHDLKNPLHTIGMAAELLDMPLAEEARSKQLAIIRRTVARANRMVNDLLDAARLQSGRTITVDPQPLDVHSLFKEAGEAFVFQAEARNQQLAFAVDFAVPPVLGDPDRLLQALANLIGNAVKFTPEGGRIHVSAGADADEEDAVRFTVADTGPGIAADMLPHLFEPFAQARDTASLGTGLGLAITRGIVEAHGGHIAVQSEPGTGTTFTFTLPAASFSDDGISPSPDERRTMQDRRKQLDDDDRSASERGESARARQISRPGPRQPPAYADPVDDALDDSFPASDPPPWWSGDDAS